MDRAQSYMTLHAGPRATVLLGDARDVLAGMETESVDLVVVDPPYGVEWQSNLRAERFDMLNEDGAGERDGVRGILEECVRVVGQNRHLYVFGPTDVLEGLKVTEPTELVWAKPMNGAGDLTAAWAPAHEPISFLVSKHRHGGQAGASTSVAARLRKGSVLTFGRPTGRKVRHPSEKPVGLLAELIESSSRAGELVLDACAGSGSTGVAAVLRGRRVLLIESHRPYAELAAERCRAAEALVAQAEAL
jgi:site-specific DNA-methyltransferase (adenine-specific)